MERQQKMTNRILLLSPLQAAPPTPPPGIKPGTVPPLVSYRLLQMTYPVRDYTGWNLEPDED